MRIVITVRPNTKRFYRHVIHDAFLYVTWGYFFDDLVTFLIKKAKKRINSLN